MSGIPVYFRYWGKAQPGEQGTWHPLIYHMLDCAAVCDELLSMDGFLIARLESTSRVDRAQLRKLLPFLIACHDVGKFTRGFQSLNQEVAETIDPDFVASGYEVRHDTAGFILLRDYFEAWHKRASLLHVTACGEIQSCEEDRWDILAPWFRAACGHHGQPPLPEGHTSRSLFGIGGIAAAEAAVRSLADLFDIDELTIPGDDSLENLLSTSAWIVAGLVVLCDWVGSNTAYFPYNPGPRPLAGYVEDAKERARHALRECGLVPVKSRPSASFGEIFPAIATPSPLQKHSDMSACTAPSPELVFIEDVTGSGKTEAALLVASRMMSAGGADGFFFALPTMATSNQMFERIRLIHLVLFETGQYPSIKLTHSARKLYAALRRDATDAKESAEIHCAAWLGDQSKKAFLSSVAVGTVDQALLSVLPSRHNVLRMLGLHRKVLIVDEVHSYDAYMNRLLQALLEFHASFGGSAILLSATLSMESRRQLMNAFARGAGGKADRGPMNDSFPLVTRWSRQGTIETPVEASARSRRTVKVSWLEQEDEAVSLIARSASGGLSVCWIRNSVDDAIEAFNHLHASHPELAGRIELFHARFILGDRLTIEKRVLDQFGPSSTAASRSGRVVIGTQVIEQSLDLDFDVMISDLAPVDLLIQRSGRLHRHARNREGDPIATPDERGGPILYVLTPPFEEEPTITWVSARMKRTSFVYPDHGRLWLTARILRQRGVIETPSDSRLLIESVYGPDAEGDIPSAFASMIEKIEGELAAERSLANIHVLKPAQGYASEGTSWLDDDAAITRLGEPTVRFRLCTHATDGSLQPLMAEDDLRAIASRSSLEDRWAFSDVSVRQAKLSGSGEETPISSMDAAKATMRDLGKWCEILPLHTIGSSFSGAGWRRKPEDRVKVVYDRTRGLVVEEETNAIQPH